MQVELETSVQVIDLTNCSLAQFSADNEPTLSHYADTSPRTCINHGSWIVHFATYPVYMILSSQQYVVKLFLDVIKAGY